jgi:hypothetical protein
MIQTSDTPIIYAWREDSFIDWSQEINCNNIIETVDWINKFSGNHRLPNDVGLPLERCVIGAYQIGYLFDYLKMPEGNAKNSYFEEGIASVILHTIAACEMMGKEFINITGIPKMTNSWNELVRMRSSVNNSGDREQRYLSNISEHMFKFERWMLYNHMGRTKRWDDNTFNESVKGIIFYCCSLAYCYECDLAEGFALCMSKLQDQEIKRH